MTRFFVRASSVLALAVLACVAGFSQVKPPSVRQFQGENELAGREGVFWQRTSLPAPAGLSLEVTGILPVAGKRLVITTRHGEIWMIDGAYEPKPQPKFTRFAVGLHEPLGIIVAPKGGYYVAQRQEITRVADENNDGRADLYETLCKIPIRGSYHEYAFGPVLAPNGNLRFTLNVAFGGSPEQGPVPWRGWMLEVTPDGQIIPIAAGLQSPTSFLVTSSGDWFCTENQGEWVGSGRVTHIQPGDFAGHPASLNWSRLPGSTVRIRPEDIRDFEAPMPEVAAKLPGLKLPAVWLPHAILGVSTSGIIEDRGAGKFGPFANQFFVADQGHSKIMRMTLEKVKGVWQGAAYAFREGFDAGIVRLAQGDEGAVFAGETARGWSSIGPKEEGLERLTWTGQIPFEIAEVTARPDGFNLTFTRPVDRALAENPASYAITGFTYLYHKTYGSPAVSQMACPIKKIVASPDRMSVRLAALCLREGYIHQIKAGGIRDSGKGEPLLHPEVYYTLNKFPDGQRIIAPDPAAMELCVSPAAPLPTGNTSRHPIHVPRNWNGAEPETMLLVGTQPGLKFDTTMITVKAGQRVQLVFRNSDDMLHNFVLCAPGRGAAVGEAAMAMGVDGAAKHYVPSSDDVLFHTELVTPGNSDTLYFTAPTTPGDYDFICSFPGHAAVMKGIFKVEPK